MDIKLTAEEATNVKVALVQLAKAPSTNEQAMAYLLNLSNKFTVKQEKKNGKRTEPKRD